MTKQELRTYIDRILGNSLRVLLPSYWWKRLFHQVADRIDEVEQSAAEMVEDAKMSIVASEKELNKLDLPKGSVAAVEEVGNASTIKISDCYFSNNLEEDWEKYTIVKRVEEKANITADKENIVQFSASKDWFKDAFAVCTLDSGIVYCTRTLDRTFSRTTLSKVNEALSSGKYRAIDNVGEPDQYFTFYSEIPQPELYIKGETWERLAKESDLVGIEGGSGDDVNEKIEDAVGAVVFYVDTNGGQLDDEYIAANAEQYKRLRKSDGMLANRPVYVKNYDGFLTAQMVVIDAYKKVGLIFETYEGRRLSVTIFPNGTYSDIADASISDGEDSEYPLFSVATNKDGTWSYAEDNEVEDIFAYTALSIRVSIDGGKPSTITHSHEYIDGVKWITLYGQGDGFLLDATLMGITKATYKFSPSFTWQGFIESTCFQFDYETGDTAIVTIKMDMLKGFSEDGLEGALISSAEFPKITEFNELKESVDDKADKTYVDEALSKTQTAIRVFVSPNDLETLIQETLADQHHAIDIDAERFEYVFGTFMKDNYYSLYYMDIALVEDENEPPYWSLTERWSSGREIGIEFTKRELDIKTRDYTYTSIYLFYNPSDPDEYTMEAQRWVIPESELKSSYTAYVDNAIANLTNEIITNEEIHAAALNDLNARIKELEERLNNAGL